MVGKRDHALLIFYFLKGLRRSEVIGLRGKDLEAKDRTLVIKYRRKGGKFTAREVSDMVAYEAPSEYLAAAARGKRLGDGAAAVEPARPRRVTRSAAHLARFRREPQGVRPGGRPRAHPSTSDAPHLRPLRGRRDGQLLGGAGGSRPRKPGDHARLRLESHGQEGQAWR